jgi:hypothetical protein
METINYRDYRMCKTIVEVLANGDSKRDILDLCHVWGIEPHTQGAAKGDFLYWETLQKLAQYVLDYTSNS